MSPPWGRHRGTTGSTRAAARADPRHCQRAVRRARHNEISVEDIAGPAGGGPGHDRPRRRSPAPGAARGQRRAARTRLHACLAARPGSGL